MLRASTAAARRLVFPTTRVMTSSPLFRPLVALALCFFVAKAHALQPLDEFLRQAESSNFDNREIRAQQKQRKYEVNTTRARLLPNFEARGTYTHNQYAAIATLPVGGETQRLVITPKNQWDAFFTVNVPVIDVAGHVELRGARELARAADADRDNTKLSVQRQIVQAYYQLLAYASLREAAKEAMDAAAKNAEVVQQRRAGGVASELDVQQANANLERTKQDLANAELNEALGRRQLETLSGLTPEAISSFPTDDLHEEAPLEQWIKEVDADLPSNRAAAARARAAESARRAAAYAFLPTLSATAQERITNATGFLGRSSYYYLGASLTWQLDGALVPRLKAQRAAQEAEEVRKERTQRQNQDFVYEAWHRIRSDIARSRAARAQASATAKAAELAAERYTGGVATQLDVVQAQRDAFAATASRVQADADLALSRAQLRLGTGRLLNAKQSDRAR